jgi:hypothetical protein
MRGGGPLKTFGGQRADVEILMRGGEGARGSPFRPVPELLTIANEFSAAAGILA